MDKDSLIRLGSETARNGFRNEDFVVDTFNDWRINDLAQKWLSKMDYIFEDIESVYASKISGSYKADVQVEIKIEIKLKKLTDIQNIQVKLVSNPRGFNQIDKRWLRRYKELWDIPDNVYVLLQHYTGELLPKVTMPRDSRRMFLDEFPSKEQELMIDFFKKNKTLIITDILKGRGKFSAEWMLVILKLNDLELQWALEPMNKVLNYYSDGEVLVSNQGNLKLAKITVQRKGGDNGRDTANMLQFKINPAEIFNI